MAIFWTRRCFANGLDFSNLWLKMLIESIVREIGLISEMGFLEDLWGFHSKGKSDWIRAMAMAIWSETGGKESDVFGTEIVIRGEGIE